MSLTVGDPDCGSVGTSHLAWFANDICLHNACHHIIVLPDVDLQLIGHHRVQEARVRASMRRLDRD